VYAAILLIPLEIDERKAHKATEKGQFLAKASFFKRENVPGAWLRTMMLRHKDHGHVCIERLYDVDHSLDDLSHESLYPWTVLRRLARSVYGWQSNRVLRAAVHPNSLRCRVNARAVLDDVSASKVIIGAGQK
jgi:hypothetical protein